MVLSHKALCERTNFWFFTKFWIWQPCIKNKQRISCLHSNFLESRCNKLLSFYNVLEIKPCRLGSRISDVEAESYNWQVSFTSGHLVYVLFLLVSRTGTVGWTKRWVNVPKCALTITFLASSLHNHGGKKLNLISTQMIWIIISKNHWEQFGIL